jgi:hypothetical protein
LIGEIGELNMEEIWKDIKGYEGLYQVSNFGNIRNKRTNKIKIPYKCKNGYMYVSLYKNNKSKNKLIHRLVAETFFKNKNNYTDVNHIDGNKLNNKIENLEFCTRSYNLKEAYRLKLREPVYLMLNKKDELCPNSKKINQYDLNGKFIKTWGSQLEIERQLGICHTNISNCCLKKENKSIKGFQWRFFNNDFDIDINPLKIKTTAKKIVQYDLQMNFIKEWNSITEASKELNICHTTISKNALGKYSHAGGYIWKYLEVENDR